MSHLSRKTYNDTGGFTIIELMIATVVFGFVLLVIASAVLQFTRVYYKGITQSSTESTAISAINSVSQAIQFDGGSIVAGTSNGSSNGWCIGGQMYSYILGHELSDSNNPSPTQLPHALVVEVYRDE